MVPSPSIARRAASRRDRGAALLVVIVSIAILTAIAVDLAYSTRVSLLTAANARDELRAEYLARSGVQLSRLVLNFQNALDASLPAGAAGQLRIQVWNVVPITSAFTEGLFGAPEEGRGTPGSFDARIEDEGSKVNVQFDQLGEKEALHVATFLQLVGDPRWDPLFDREHADGQRYTRPDLAVNLRDWTDPNAVTSAWTGAWGKAFEDGFGDENLPYSRGDDRYRSKNARFDSLEELFLVAGIDDAVMEAFAGQVTVYPGKNAGWNPNTTDTRQLVAAAAAMAIQPPPLQILLAQEFVSQLETQVSLARQGGAVALSCPQFAGIVEGLGVPMEQRFKQQPATGAQATSACTEKSSVFRVRASGGAGSVERRLDAVVSFDTAQVGTPAPELGGLLHWREE